MDTEIKAALETISLIAYDFTLSQAERLQIIKEKTDSTLKLIESKNPLSHEHT